MVTQQAGNIERFGAEAIHNTGNLMKIPESLHKKVSAFYASKQSFSEGQRVRQWIGQKSFQEQYEFGIQTLKDLGW